MVQGGGGTGLAAKPFQRFGVAFDLLRKELECDQTAQADVLGLIHDPHPATADFLDDAIVRNGLAHHLGGPPSCATHVRSCACGKSMRSWAPSYINDSYLNQGAW